MFRLQFISMLVACSILHAAEPKTGPQTEKRFPKLQLPAGFEAKLFACDPLIEYPSVIAPGFRNGTLLVAIDYMTGLGTDIVRHDEIRLLEDTDGDGYADKATVYADGFNSIQGLAQHNGVVYVMHSPYLTALRDTKGTGTADERRDLIKGLGLRPEDDQIRLHNANGVVVGHDGWLYLAMGDRGCNVTRPEGDKLVLEGGGILRCRPDGRDLHVLSKGLRNIYDVALDADLNVFVRDNENDGGTYKVRICHSFFGADHGYPYLYDERPDLAMKPVSDRGLGAPAGGLWYLESQFSADYRGRLLFCEWGRAVVRSQLARDGASFRFIKESDFAAGATNDPYGFKPTDLVVDRDGSLFMSDWGDGQRPKRGRGRIYHVRYVGDGAQKQPLFASDPDELAIGILVGQLDSERHWIRRTAQEAIERRGKDGLAAVLAAMKAKKLGSMGWMHAVWIIAKIEGNRERLLEIAKTTPNPRVQVQALRAIADLTDPVLVKHRLDAGRGDEAIAKQIAAFVDAPYDLPMRLEAIVALGRLRWKDAPAQLKSIDKPDHAMSHAMQQTLRQSGNWNAVLKLLDDPSMRAIALRALAEQIEPTIVDGLIERLKSDADSTRRAEYAELLTRVCKKPGPWVYWGFRPVPRPANSVNWDRTDTIASALDTALIKLDSRDRAKVLQRMMREKIPIRVETLAKLITDERDEDHVGVILTAIANLPAEQTLSALENIVRDSKRSTKNRLQAATIAMQAIKDDKKLIAIAEAIEDGPVLAEMLRVLGTRKSAHAIELLLDKAISTKPEVRMQAIAALGEIGASKSHPRVAIMLGDADARVRAAAVVAAKKMMLRPFADQLLKMASDPDAEVRSASLTALGQFADRRAIQIAVRALENRDTTAAALDYLGEVGGVDQAAAVVESAKREPSVERLSSVAKVLTGWLGRAKPDERAKLQLSLAQLHGHSGTLIAWRYKGPITLNDSDGPVLNIVSGVNNVTDKWPMIESTGMESRVRFGLVKQPTDTWLSYAEIEAADAVAVEFFTASTGLETIWINDKQAFKREKPAAIGPYPDRFDATLTKGINRVLVRFGDAREWADFQLRFRRKSATPVQERYTAASLSRAGNPARGKEIFMNAEKSLCMKCHRVGDTGERFGPELTGLGSRFSKAHIIESILEPSRAISPSFETVVIDLKNERSVSGLKIEETETTVVLVDNQAKKHVLAKADIDSRRKSGLSTMPDGFEKTFTEDEFVDLISYLVSLKAEQKK